MKSAVGFEKQQDRSIYCFSKKFIALFWIKSLFLQKKFENLSKPGIYTDLQNRFPMIDTWQISMSSTLGI